MLNTQYFTINTTLLFTYLLILPFLLTVPRVTIQTTQLQMLSTWSDTEAVIVLYLPDGLFLVTGNTTMLP